MEDVMKNKLKEFEALHDRLIKLSDDLEFGNLPVFSDERLKQAELAAIETINYLLDACITELREQIKGEK
jgi:hypothetical protein